MTDLPQPAHGERGRLEYDSVEDALRCHVCGRWYRNLAQHVRLKHNMDADDYREYAGLNHQTRLITPTMRERLREATAPTIARLRAEGKLKRWNEDPAKWQHDKAAAVAAIREGLRSEGSERRRQSWDADRRQEQAEQRRQRNLAGLDRATPEAIREGLQRAAGEGTCERCGQTYQRRMPRQRHCDACAADAQRDYQRQYKRARQGEPKPWHRPAGGGLEWEATCGRCGQTFTAKSHREKYCATCRPLVFGREYQREWRRQQRERKRPQPAPEVREL